MSERDPRLPAQPSPQLRHLIDGLRAVASFYESHPEAYYDGMTLVLSMYASGSTAGRVLAGMAGAFGECDRTFQRGYISVAKNFSPKVKLEIFARVPR